MCREKASALLNFLVHLALASSTTTTALPDLTAKPTIPTSSKRTGNNRCVIEAHLQQIFRRIYKITWTLILCLNTQTVVDYISMEWSYARKCDVPSDRDLSRSAPFTTRVDFRILWRTVVSQDVFRRLHFSDFNRNKIRIILTQELGTKSLVYSIVNWPMSSTHKNITSRSCFEDRKEEFALSVTTYQRNILYKTNGLLVLYGRVVAWHI